MSLFNIILLLGAIGIIIPRVRRNGPVAGIIFSIFPIIGLAITMLILAAFWGMIKMAAYNYDDGPEKEQEAWRQEQIASTGVDPCTEFHDSERQRRDYQQRVDSGEISQGEAMMKPLSDQKYRDLTWEERDAALKHDYEMRQKCPPLDFIEQMH